MVSQAEISKLKQKAAFWADQFPVSMVLDSNGCNHALGLGKYELLIAVGEESSITPIENSFESLHHFRQNNPGKWMFGWFTYDLKNQLEKLVSNHPDGIGFAPLYFFIPKKLIVITREGEVAEGREWIDEVLSHPIRKQQYPTVWLKPKVAKEDYLANVNRIRTHIENGDVYELNYCVEFFATDTKVHAPTLYHQLKEKSAVPFGSFVKHHQRYVMGASPERFITKRGSKVYSQPIKGTAKRSADANEDQNQAQRLLNSEKERAENLMIVDLVRNDLAHTAETGSIKVEELFGIYSFPQVHQMISTISSTLKAGVSSIDAIRYAFPMGSMTGAPKIMAMKLIEQYEETKRGLYSGSVGYFAPDGDFDFNVVIRSIQYNEQSGYLNYEVGGAITYDSVATSEYEECLLKAKAMQEALKGFGG
jgi:para-aminobenzoate synthetase component I